MPQPRITMRKIREVLRLHFESGRSIRQINVSTKTSIGAGMVGVHYSDPNVVNEDDSRAHAGLVITDQEPVPQSLEGVVLPAVPCAVLTAERDRPVGHALLHLLQRLSIVKHF